MRRTWTGVGRAYTDDADRPRVEQQIDALVWKVMPADGDLSLPMMPALGLQAVIDDLQLPKVTMVAHNGCLDYPDGDDMAHYGLYGVECHYADGRCRVYVLDAGTNLVPLASDFWPSAPAVPVTVITADGSKPGILQGNTITVGGES